MGRLVAIVVALVGCGSSHSTVDAAVPDARSDAAPTCANMMCGATCCATAAYECTPACTCPTGVVPQPFSTVIVMMDATRQAPAVLGIGVVSSNSKLNALVVGFDPMTTPLNTDLTLPTAPLGAVPFIALGYDVNVATQTTRSTFMVSQGTLNLTRRCAAGVAGSIRGVMMREQTSMTNAMPAAMGCTVAIPDLTFDYGGSCP